jgi:endonuclease/exonuclease/phosphatase family metal-dependent hydrolase
LAAWHSRIVALALFLGGAAVLPTATPPGAPASGLPSCRAFAPSPDGGVPVKWVVPESDRRELDRWCAAVGPVLTTVPAEELTAAPSDELAVVSWNVHVGGGDLVGLVARARAGDFTGGRPVRHVVLLLQEAYREGSAVPSLSTLIDGFASAIRPSTGRRERTDVAAAARTLGLALYYAPSMRNGPPAATDEDRGNAILSTLPLADLTAIELPFERQRRVAVAATVRGRTTGGRPWQVVVASVHLDNLVGLRHAWIFGGLARQRQARGLLEALPREGAVVVGGDLNSWAGYRDPAFLELATAFPDSPTDDRRPTFAGILRLDHLFFRLEDGWTATARRLDDPFGSDHYPLIGSIRFRPRGADLTRRLP